MRDSQAVRSVNLPALHCAAMVSPAHDDPEANELMAEIARLRAENARLRALLDDDHSDGSGDDHASGTNLRLRSPQADASAEEAQGRHTQRLSAASLSAASPNAAKTALFRSLFRGRDDVYAKRWESTRGTTGYSPVCANEWRAGLCEKPKVKCGACRHRDLLPLDDAAIHDHLSGRAVLGVYPLLEDETCHFLAIDLDGAGWREDARAFIDALDELELAAHVEISRSGAGAHVWLFFDGPIPARQARRLGCALISLTARFRHQLSLASYDRLFPSQDTLPKGGFGNLIALPLQRTARADGRTVFVDRDLNPHEDQWKYLAAAERLSADVVEAVLTRLVGRGGPVGVRAYVAHAAGGDTPWELPPPPPLVRPGVAGRMPSVISLTRGNLVYVDKTRLPESLLDQLIRLAAFENPEFHRAQALRLPTYDKPRVIGCAEEFERHIGLPRGCMDEVVDLLEGYGSTVAVRDERNLGRAIDLRFLGELRPEQRRAADEMLAHDDGVLSAGTAFGKTVVAAHMIAQRGVNTLVLVHRRQLLEQWRERLSTFLDVSPEAIGRVGGGVRRPGGSLDVAVIQSVVRRGRVDDFVADYGHIIVDECHHVSAVSFEAVLRHARAKYVLGLTATPVRKDGHHPIITMQCGPVRFKTDPRRQAAARPFAHVVRPSMTSFVLPPGVDDPGIQEVYRLLAEDEDRNSLLVDDIVAAVDAGRSPLVLTERTRHRDLLAARLTERVANVFSLSSGASARRRRALAEAIAAVSAAEPRVIVATGRLAGEGIDDARLDTLFLAMPISWRGTLQQYAGRLHRLYDEKTEVVIHDYVDAAVPVLARMYEKRRRGYRAMGYDVEGGKQLEGGRDAEGGCEVVSVCERDSGVELPLTGGQPCPSA